MNRLIAGRMIRTARHKKGGYTLVELMITVAIVGILASVGPPLMINLQNFYLMTTARNNIERDARNTLDTVNRYLRQAQGGTVTISTPANEGPYSRIDFTTIDGRSMAFYQNGSQLVQQINSAVTTVSKNLVYIAFTFPRSDDPTIVSVSITMGTTIQLGQKKVLELTIQKVRIMNP